VTFPSQVTNGLKPILLINPAHSGKDNKVSIPKQFRRNSQRKSMLETVLGILGGIKLKLHFWYILNFRSESKRK
jgi:hypothetical protein